MKKELKKQKKEYNTLAYILGVLIVLLTIALPASIIFLIVRLAMSL